MQIDRVDLGRAPAESDFEKNLEKSFQRLLDQLSQLFKNGILFSDNFDCYMGDLTTSAVIGTESEIAHDLGKVPTGYIITKRDKAAIIYNGDSAWTVSKIYVKADTASVAIGILVF